MPSVLILCAHRPNRSPSQRYRFEQYLPFLESHGFSFHYSYLLNERDDKIFYSQGHALAKARVLAKTLLIRLNDLFRLKKFDIIFIQREASFIGSSFVERRAAKSAYTIFDFDDSIWLADTSPGNKKWEWIKRPAKFFEIAKAAHRVIAGNVYLAQKANAVNANTVIIPTTIDTSVHQPQPGLRNKAVITIGWSGSMSTVKHFELLLPVFTELKKKYGSRIRFKLIGEPGYKHPALEVEAIAWSEATEVEQLNSLDIGVMPLPDDEWAKGKCGLKGLSYMACGVATVMSAVGVNNHIIQQGENGFLASSQNDWLHYLSLLIEDEALRNKLGSAGRNTVVKQYSVEVHALTYLQLFKQRIN